MKTKSAVYAGIAGIIGIILVLTVTGNNDFTNENKIRVAYFPNIGHAIPIVGTESGFFSDKLGNDIEIESRLFDSGPQVIESLFANSVDIAYVGPGPAINGFLKSQNHNVKILSGAASGGASFVVHPNSSISSADDFHGKRIAAPQIANTQDVSLRHYMSENNLKSAEKGGSVVVLNVPNPDIYTLFAKGDIDAAWVPEPWATILVEELDGNRLFFEEDLWPNKQFASVLLIARSDYVDNNPLVIQGWLESHTETANWINENPDDTTLIFNQFMKKYLGKALPEKIVNESLLNLEITSDPIGDSIYTFAERADTLGYLGRNGYDLQGIFYEEKLEENI